MNSIIVLHLELNASIPKFHVHFQFFNGDFHK